MIRRTIFLVVFACLPFSPVLSQDRITFLSAEAGIDILGYGDVNNEYIWQTFKTVYYSIDGTANNLQSSTDRVYYGAKIEVRSKNNKFGLLMGARFSRLTSRIVHENDDSYFFLMLPPSGTTTDYLRIKALRQVSNFIGVPVEVRYFPWGHHRVSTYFLMGGDVSYRLNTTNHTTFFDSSMAEYEGDVAAVVGDAGTWSSTFYGRAGIIIGREKPWLDIGITLPTFISQASSSLTDASFGGGFYLQVQKRI